MFLKFFRTKKDAGDETSPAEPPSLEPERLLPSRLTDDQKRKIFYGVAAVVTVIILANLFGPNSTAPVAKSAGPGSTLSSAGPTTAQIAEFQANLRQTEQQFREAEAEKEKAIADVKAMPELTAADIENAEALRDANEARQQYARSEGSQGTSKQQLKAERDQQAYKSLFADNLVRQESAPLSLQSSLAATPPTVLSPRSPSSYPAGDGDSHAAAATGDRRRKQLDFDPAKQQTYWLPEGTIIEAVLTNRLDGEQPGPVNAMVTTDVYVPGSRLLLFPAGSRLLGEASKVSEFGQQRLAVAFHRLLVPGTSPYSIPLDKLVPGLAQAGEVGLHDQVNNHYASIFGASLAIGAIGGLAQIGNSGSSLSYDPSAQFRNGVSQSMAQSSDRVLDKFLNRMPSITIREGTRIKILLTNDLSIPAFPSGQLGDF